MFSGDPFQSIIDLVISLVISAITLQFSAFFTFLELFQTLTGGPAV